MTKFGIVTHVEEGVFVAGRPHPYPKGRVHALTNPLRTHAIPERFCGGDSL